jgi:single-stranded-DNA-specific exonuclease
MDALETGAWDIICTTPEFMQFHADRFVNEHSRPSLVVVDEAHHLIESTHRPAYRRTPEVVRKLGSPQVLALTATADDDVFAGIRRELEIEAWVIDPTIRENLTVTEARGTTNKVDYIRRNIDPEGKAIVYCNSRTEATKVAEKLRTNLGDIVAFYHAGVGSAERLQVEQFFRAGTIRVIVPTCATCFSITSTSITPSSTSSRAAPDATAKRRTSTCSSANAIATSTTSFSSATRRRCTRCATSTGK